VRAASASWQASVVNVEVARKQYDYAQPWTRRNRRQLKVGAVVEGRMVVTSADEVFDRTLVRLRSSDADDGISVSGLG
jgi:hypothetical protein